MLRLGRRFLITCRPSLYSSRVISASAAKVDRKDLVEKSYVGYTVIETAEVPEFHAHATLLRHNGTGAEHLHVYRDDPNNVFSVGFRTPPKDSTGAPHILEHTVLCGSEKYPCRDPFFKMLNRSLSTFMNAFTASDWTMYPYSTQNLKDYSNLMSVYLDAVFRPNLKELDFRQEGWRLENSDVRDRNSDMIFKGVVFNEMKGALSTAESIYCTKHQLLLLPHSYGHVSGGEPLDIPKLTWEGLREFHRLHYHPSNARFFTYGNFPLDKTLEQIHNDVLENFQKINPGTELDNEPRWTEPRYEVITCPPDPLAADPEKQSIVSVSYALPYIKDPFESFVLGILSPLLVNGPNSPFYQTLVEKNIGTDYSPVVGVDSSTRNPTFSVGLQGLHKDNIKMVTDIIEDTFNNVYKDGFDNNRIESILHRVELAQKHQTSSFGLHLVMGLFPSWNQDKNPLLLLKFNEHVENFKKALETNPTFLQEKVKEYFLDNTHKLTLVMHPEATYTKDQEMMEAELLKEKLLTLSETDKEEIYIQGLELEKLQNELEDVSVLPKMSIQDINKKINQTVYSSSMSENVNTYLFPQPTNGVTYFRCITTTSSIPYTLKPYLPLFSNVVTRLGAAGKSHRELEQLIELTTGGLSVSPHLTIDHSDEDTYEQGISFASHCLKRNIPMMFSLWQDVLNEPHFLNEERLRTLINAYASDLSVSIANSGHIYAMSAAAKFLTPSSQISEILSGLSQVEFMKHIAESSNLDSTVEHLMKIATYMLNANEMRCSLNAIEADMELSQTALTGMLSSLYVVGFEDPDIIENQSFQPHHSKVFIEMDFPVNYVSRCVRTVPYTHEDHPKLQILAKLLSAKFLHREIREKGGAYGGGARMSGGIFAFYSYRDPNTIKTLDAFSKSVDWAQQGQFKDDDIDEAKLSVFSMIDHPVSPANVGIPLFQNRLTDKKRQKHRDGLFAVTRDDLIDVSNKYLVDGAQIHAEAIIGPKNQTLIGDSLWTIRRKLELLL